MPPKESKLIIQWEEVNFAKSSDFLSLTDLAKKFSEAPEKAIENWMRNKDTIEFLGLWEILNNPEFKPPEFEGFRNEAWTNRFLMSPTKWIKATNAKWIRVRSGRFFWGTSAHIDIALEFASWIDPRLKLYIIKEFQRLKAEEAERLESGWETKRALTKINYRIHTDAVKQYLVWKFDFTDYVYANEADMLNVIVYGETHAEWVKKNKNTEGNQRDNGTVDQLVILNSLETINAMLIKDGIPRKERAEMLHAEALRIQTSLLGNKSLKKLK